MTSKSCPILRPITQQLVFHLFNSQGKANHHHFCSNTIHKSYWSRNRHCSHLYHGCLTPFGTRSLSTYKKNLQYSSKVQKYDRGPQSSEDTQTDFGTLDILANTPAPSTSIDACLWDGFHLNNGVKITGGMGVLLIGGKAFSWQPWIARKDNQKKLLNEKRQWEVEDETWGIFEVSWPRPDLLILGLGKEMHLLSPKTSSKIYSLGIRLEIQDTRNAAAQFNLLATERGINNVAAALIPIGWKEDDGV
ncbi:putative duf498 domain protein [Erysiphe neolycopersici]|uniref:NADH dehydrogenase [ubiquinone] 1 alpha subcomplex assembly factor 3 n=1 Tax=Erysiphe neolycopersici TaxID=212602 RepID=A0A420I1S0_9PEZI|nr:putative duf498 domain protein [Erysiphe neolycopersici]